MANPLKDLIERRLEELGISAHAASIEVGAPRGFIQGILKQPDSHHPRIDTLRKLARALQLPLEDVLAASGDGRDNGGGTPDSGAHSRPDFRRGSEVRLAPPDLVAERPGLWARDVPVLGTAAGSVVGGYDFRFEGGIIDYVRRPPALAEARDIYAIYITGSSMDPEHRAGDLRFVNPLRPPAIGDTVIIQVKAHEHGEPEAYIKHLTKRTAERLVATQLNPAATIEFAAGTVTAVHKVLSMNELFGV